MPTASPYQGSTEYWDDLRLAIASIPNPESLKGKRILVTGATGKPSVGIIINDFSNGNDMIVGAPGINSLKDLEGKKVGVEEGFVCHLLLLTGLEKNGIDPSKVTVVNTPTNETPQVLQAKAVDAIGAWQPNSGQALKAVPGSKPVFTSKDVPGIIYDLLYVSPESLDTRKEDWAKVVAVWYKIAEFIRDEENLDETLEILSGRVGIKPEEYEAFLKGTYILTLEEALERWEDKEGLGSVYGSTRFVDTFNLKFEVYEKSQDATKYLNPSFTKAYAESLKSE
jgi:NitT/TauT family transport system substrate-binding protein